MQIEFMMCQGVRLYWEQNDKAKVEKMIWNVIQIISSEGFVKTMTKLGLTPPRPLVLDFKTFTISAVTAEVVPH